MKRNVRGPAERAARHSCSGCEGCGCAPCPPRLPVRRCPFCRNPNPHLRFRGIKIAGGGRSQARLVCHQCFASGPRVVFGGPDRSEATRERAKRRAALDAAHLWNRGTR